MFVYRAEGVSYVLPFNACQVSSFLLQYQDPGLAASARYPLLTGG
jgi:hypothetical protein